MKVADARKMLVAPVFGDPNHIKALAMLSMLTEMGSTGPGTSVDVDGIECEECEGTGDCPHCGQSCPECDDGAITVTPQDIEEMDEDGVSDLHDRWMYQHADAAINQ